MYENIYREYDRFISIGIGSLRRCFSNELIHFLNIDRVNSNAERTRAGPARCSRPGARASDGASTGAGAPGGATAAALSVAPHPTDPHAAAGAVGQTRARLRSGRVPFRPICER